MPAGLPWGKPGMGDDMEGAMQHAAQPGRQFMACIVCLPPRDVGKKALF